MSIYKSAEVKATFFNQLGAENTHSADSFGAKKDAIDAKHPLGWAVAGIFMGLALTGVGFLGLTGGLSHIPNVVQLLPEAFKNYYVMGVNLGVGVVGVGILGRSAVVCDGNRAHRNEKKEPIDEAERGFETSFRLDLFNHSHFETNGKNSLTFHLPREKCYQIEEDFIAIRDFDMSVKSTQKLTAEEKGRVVTYLQLQGFREHIAEEVGK